MQGPPIEHDLTPDLFRAELTSIMNMDHELCQLSGLINWDRLDEQFALLFDSSQGTPATATRLIAGLFYLKAAYHVSDDDLIHRWVENPYWQYFCGEQYWQHEFPIDRTTLSKWRKRLKASDCETLLSETIAVGLKTEVIKDKDLEAAIVDTTVQEKAITYPTDSKLYHKARELLVKRCKEDGLMLRQSYVRLSKHALYWANRYGHAKQMKRMKKQVRKLKTYLGCVTRDVQRQLEKHPDKRPFFDDLLQHAERLLLQEKTSKNKLYSLHAPEVECIAKGKSNKRYEFGVKVSIATPHRTNFVIGVTALSGNPYDGHTLSTALDQVEALTGKRPSKSYVDLGYRGHDETQSEVIIAGTKKKTRTRAMRRAMKRRSAVEPLIGHMKTDHALGRNYLKGSHGDQLNALFSGIGYNLRVILKKLRFLFALFLSWLFGNFEISSIEDY